MRKLPTGEPFAGPHARFGGRGRRKPFPPLSDGFEIPGFRVALAIASLPGMTIELCCEFLNQDSSPL